MQPLFSIIRKQTGRKTPLAGVVAAVIVFATLVAAPRAFAATEVSTSVVGDTVCVQSGLPDYGIASHIMDTAANPETGMVSIRYTFTPYTDMTSVHPDCFDLTKTTGRGISSSGPSDSWPIDDGTYYYVVFANYCQSGNDDCPVKYYGKFYVTGGNVYGTATTTHITETYPASGSTTPSYTFPIGAKVYVSDSDWKSDLFLHVELVSTGGTYCANSAIAIDAITCAHSGGANPIIQTFDFPITSQAIEITLATSTTQEMGLWDARYSIRDPYFFGLFHSTLVATSTQFIVASTTPIDDVILQTRASLASTALTYFTNCNPLSSWDFMKCLSAATTYLFTPNTADLNRAVNSLHDDVLVRAPIGYITRVVAIMSSTTPVEPPAISYTFGSSSPAELQGKNYTIQPLDHFDVVGQIKSDDGQNKGVWDVIDPLVTVMVVLSVFYVVVSDVIKLGSHEIAKADRQKKKTT